MALSFNFFDFLSVRCCDHNSVNVLNLWYLFDHIRLCFIFSLVSVDRVVYQHNSFKFRQLRKLTYFVPLLDLVVTNEECMELDARLEAVQLFYKIVGKPEFL